jgi:hypothetical protein
MSALQQRRFQLPQQFRVHGPVAREDLLDLRRQLRPRLADGLLQLLKQRGFRFPEK